MTTCTSTSFDIQAGSLRFAFLNSGDIREITSGPFLINQWLANPIDGSLNNLYLRLHREEGIEAIPLLGVHSGSRFRYSGSQVIWEGTAEGMSYRVTFTLTPRDIWFWDVQVSGTADAEIDLVYGQDLGLADRGAVRSNEAYLSQYIDHTVFDDSALGRVVCSRQNQPQGTLFPYMQQGSLTKAAGFSTDGFQFFGLSYKETDKPEALSRNELANEIYQYEFAYTALQSERVRIGSGVEAARFVFYGLFKPNHPEAVTSLEYEEEVAEAWELAQRMYADDASGANGLAARSEGGAAAGFTAAKPVLRSADIGKPLTGESFTSEEIRHYFPERRLEERQEDELLSFFTETYEHVVLQAKELQVERPHGHILMSGDNARLNESVITSTSYMYGVFNSQLTVGNTSFNKMLTHARNALNVPKTAGQRIYIESGGEFRLLTLPSLFEIGFNYTRWYYKMPGDTVIITNFTAADAPEVHLQIVSEQGKAYRYLVTNQVVMNNNEYEVPFCRELEADGQTIAFTADNASDSAAVWPDLRYRMRVEGAGLGVTDESRLAPDAAPGSASLVVLEIGASASWSLTVQGLLRGEEAAFTGADAAQEAARYRDFLESVMNGFRLSRSGAGTDESLDKMNALAWWYTHNMLVHYSVPHGLEQYGGAAWGTRDVCQGPMEYFAATGKYDEIRDILRTLYAHQYEDEGNWPQWFMFDRYAHIQQEESHGDVIVWPLKILGDYLAATGDVAFLQEKLPYTKRHTFGFTEEQASLKDHVRKEVQYIQRNFLHDTHLSSYGDGDWDDTLQPANARLKKYMVSSWTVALTYQAVRQLSAVLTEADPDLSAELGEMAAGIKRDFSLYVLNTDVIPGFVYMEKPGETEFMLHPSDTKTGISYRLLPMTRSMISELFTPEQAEAHYRLIKEEMYYPDGVRLMNRPAHYDGGVSRHFKRAEQAANLGREVGLQYVHAHIRFVEAMAKLGKADEVWRGLQVINPVRIQDVVPSAELRQSNAYFSSSDGKFNTRYEAQERFGELRDGSVAVKGGWRIYSSGPGIYMNQLISSCLGIRTQGGDLVVDPVLPADLDGLRFDFRIMDIPVTFLYHAAGKPVRRVSVNGHDLITEEVANRYRAGGLRIKREELLKHLSGTGRNVIELVN
ncbi:GH36-type glycosyl hydrolase domain-containing protein [Paenibacillus lutrae]|uniref:Cellobiose phosphorylase n=1 Tax=Paenibacillus lutrae TaxID=2078573 RepID=A0A7X3FKS2_9BACL|nr:cellobiose phosphorylase [Paenibacillus lutrae]MVP01309.1 cellobiose phosphorylase [Paenibacillus lutrae]